MKAILFAFICSTIGYCLFPTAFYFSNEKYNLRRNSKFIPKFLEFMDFKKFNFVAILKSFQI